MKTKLFSLLKLVLLLILTNSLPFISQGKILIDFGSTASQNSFELDGWNQVLLSSNQNYTNLGNGGVYVTSNFGDLTDFRGIKGKNRNFSKGERVVVTWYNNFNEPISFSSRISFDDPDIPDGGPVSGSWFTMRNFGDYSLTHCIIEPFSNAKTVFNIENKGVHKTDKIYNIININLAIEWGNNEMKQYLICDRIEILFDADTLAPEIPKNLKSEVKSHSRIKLNWEPTKDNTVVAGYFIYNGDLIEGYSKDTNYTVALLEAGKSYTFSVTAVDPFGNESSKSNFVTTKTDNFTGKNNLINPNNLKYLGAIKMPESINYGGEGIAYNPNGDGGQNGIGAVDGFPGSVFISNINTPEDNFVAEFSLPSFKLSSNLSDLNEPYIIQNFTNIRPSNVNNWSYVDNWIMGLTCIPIDGTDDFALYSSWGYYYQVGGEKTASLSFCFAKNLSSSQKYGAWYIGKADSPPIDAALNDYLFKVPEDWAKINTNNRTIITGRSREGGLSGLGPTLYAVAPVNHYNPPTPNSELSELALLQYGSVENSDGYKFPNSFICYNHKDWFRAGFWLQVGSQKAIALYGNKGLGKNWYGYTGENMHHDWVLYDIPYPDFSETDPNGKGWRANNVIPMIVFYDVDELAEVAKGNIKPYEPQPYAALRLENIGFFGKDRILRDATYDPINNILYGTEFIEELEGVIVLHAWKIYDSVNDIDFTHINYSNPTIFPNPASDYLEISNNVEADLGAFSTNEIKIYNIFGECVMTVFRGDQANIIRIDISALPAGLYFIKFGKFIGKFIIV
ncbi:MAG: T9SS type A sorting domain-containing protein [Candidatus Kapabacteria bacterium]|nr:T9SS type A sorting domain-containing protein [Candidatus Kapabacteria bacterium]